MPKILTDIHIVLNRVYNFYSLSCTACIANCDDKSVKLFLNSNTQSFQTVQCSSLSLSFCNNIDCWNCIQNIMNDLWMNFYVILVSNTIKRTKWNIMLLQGKKRETFKIINRHCASYESLLWISASNFYI